jgi:predicted alpha-1,2-mannosidase
MRSHRISRHLTVRKAGLPPLLLLVFSLTCIAQPKDYTRWVNPFIGTGGHGHTFPGAVMPFGMVQLSPDTRGADWDGSSGYHYSDDIIYGFSHTHLSGTGIPDGCDILFMPELDGPMLYRWPGEGTKRGTGSKFLHANERSEPGYYSVKFDDGIFTELTATERVGMHRYTFPRTENDHPVNITLNLKWRDTPIDTEINVVGTNRIEGFRRSKSWARDQIVYFVAEFSKPFTPVYAFTHDDPEAREQLRKTKRGLIFESRNGTQVLVKVALSSVSIEGARKNLAAELPGWDFDKVRAAAKAAWNKELSKIGISGGTDAQTTTFYTALYHTMIQPNVFNDVDGNYRGMDGKVHSLSERESEGASERHSKQIAPSHPPALAQNSQYTVFSLWDTFRAEHPLFTIIDKKRTADFINTFIRMYEQGGRLPIWELWGNETDTMIGYHAVSVIADAMAKGIKGFDYEKAYEAAKHSAELDRNGLAAYKRRGYISSEDDQESVSKTLEYAYDDWCIAQMASLIANKYEEIGHTTDKQIITERRLRYDEDFRTYMLRSRYFENLFDPHTGFMRPKKNGGFISPFAPNDVTFNYTEGNAWVYSFFVPQDIGDLITLMGGREKFAAKLDELFTTKEKLTGREQPDITGLIGQYAHGNEPSHHIAYLYNYAGQPWKAQSYVRQILDEFYSPNPDGLIGNEDCGQMSAWYVLSSTGMYQVTPGSPFFDLSAPLFPLIKYHLENGKTFTIRAEGVSPRNKYVRGVRINATSSKVPILPYEEIQNGGTVEFEMSDKPSDGGFAPFHAERSVHAFPAVPVIEGPGRVFSDKATIKLWSLDPEAELFYSINSNVSETKYTGPFTIDSNAKIVAKAFDKSGMRSSLVAEATFSRKPNDWTVSIASLYNRQYTAGGDEGLIDGIRGTTNFTSEWQGYQGKDFVATIDLKKETEIKSVGGGFLQVVRSWIWMPTHIEIEVSQDDVNFSRVADIKTDVALDDMEPKTRDFVTSIKPTHARYVRIHAYNLGKIPTWHPGAGGEPWIFVDEILVN